MNKFLLVGLGVAAFSVAPACGSDSDKGTGTPNAGGTPSAGGAPVETGGTPAASGGTTPEASGGTPAASGGSVTQTGGTPATGGSTDTGGTPASGGDTSTGGSAPMTDGSAPVADAGYPPNPGTVDVVVCSDDGNSCTASENCCYTAGLDPKHACNAKPCTGGDVAIACDGREDCHSGQECCRVGNSFTCRDSCGAAATLNCGGPANCPSGTVCCQHTFLGNATETECTDTCTGGGNYIMCNKKSDCPANAPNCVGSFTMPGFRYCAP